MSKYAVVAKSDALQAKRKQAVEPKKGRTLEAREDAPEAVESFGRPFLSFRYSYTEITAAGGTPRVKAQRARYENGRLESERFEGEVDRSGYERMLAEAQRQFAHQTASMLRSVFSFLPLFGGPRPEED